MERLHKSKNLNATVQQLVKGQVVRDKGRKGSTMNSLGFTPSDIKANELTESQLICGSGQDASSNFRK